MKTPKIAAVLILIALVAGSASALDLTSFPEPIEKGSLLISPSFGLGTFYTPGWAGIGSFSNTMLGGTVAVDYALPINFALTVGLEAGFYGANSDKDGKSSINVIPIIARIAWHPNWEVKGLDTYLLAKIGYGIGFWGGDMAKKTDGLTISNPGGLIYGFNVGIRYFFTDKIGVFAEGGYEYYFLKYNYELDLGVGKIKNEFGAYANKFVSAGVTFKL